MLLRLQIAAADRRTKKLIIRTRRAEERSNTSNTADETMELLEVDQSDAGLHFDSQDLQIENAAWVSLLSSLVRFYRTLW